VRQEGICISKFQQESHLPPPRHTSHTLGVKNLATLKITLVKSVIGRPQDQRGTVKALGLGKTNSSVVREDSPIIMGMIKKVSHLVKVEEV